MVAITRLLTTAVLATATMAAVIPAESKPTAVVPTQQGANRGSSHIKRENEVGSILSGAIEVFSGQW